MILKYTIVISIAALLLGFISQRSRMCFIGGVRDWVLIRDHHLLRGLISFIFTVWLLTSVFYSIGLMDTSVPEVGEPADRNFSIFIGEEERAAVEEKPFIEVIGSADKKTVLSLRFLLFTFIGGIIMGAVGIAANGCVLRQHVLIGQGHLDSLLFVIGMILMNIIFYLFLYKMFSFVY